MRAFTMLRKRRRYRRLPRALVIPLVLVLGFLFGFLLAATTACGGSHGTSPDAAPAADAASCTDPSGCDGSPGVDAAACAAVAGDGRRLLSQMGLYADVAAQVLAAGVTEYQPAYPLWSDGTDKRRFVALPPGAQIDTSNMDHWQFPVGTKFFKEFALGGQRLETRVIERTASTGGDADYAMATFVWVADGCDAVETPQGVRDVLGTAHDVPAAGQCVRCHAGEPGRVLGFSAIQLSKPGPPPTLASLIQDKRLTAAPPGGTDYRVPGDAATAAALGYLHANCGHCHNPNAVPPVNALSMNLRLNVGDRTPATTTIWTTTVNVPTQLFQAPDITARVAADNPDGSAIVYRMGRRGTAAQMPSLATKKVDAAGLAAVRAWIASLPAAPAP